MNKENKNLKKELIIKIIIILILLILIFITSFRTGQKFYYLTNTNFDDTQAKVESDVARWTFNVKIIYGGDKSD